MPSLLPALHLQASDLIYMNSSSMIYGRQEEMLKPGTVAETDPICAYFSRMYRHLAMKATDNPQNSARGKSPVRIFKENT